MDLQKPKWMYLKAGLFVLIVLCSFILIWVEGPTRDDHILSWSLIRIGQTV
jgi:hypothetical protein